MVGKSALITGATGYLGVAMAHALAEAGAHVWVNSRSSVKSIFVVESIIQKGFLASPAVFDISVKSEVDLFFLSLKNKPLHVLINNAYAGGAGTIEQSVGKSYQDSYNITMVAAHNMLSCALNNLHIAHQESGDASIINIASMYALISPDHRLYESANMVNPPFYGAAKAALLQWTRYAACEFGSHGLRVNAISPGPFPSKKVQKTNPNFIQQLEKKVPLGRVGQADEIKAPVLFLASSASSYVNGANIIVDGGWTCW